MWSGCVFWQMGTFEELYFYKNANRQFTTLGH